MFDRVIITYRGATYEIGRGWEFYGIWMNGAPRSAPLERWPETPEGWAAAWARFTSIETPGTIVPVGKNTPPVGSGAGQDSGQAGPNAATAPGARIVAAALIGVGVVLGVAGLFPPYVGAASLARHAEQVIPHAIYLAAWTASVVLILLGGARLRLGALLGLGLSAVTFGLFFADAGLAIAGTATGGGAGLVLSCLGWVACAAGSVLAFGIRPGRRAGPPGPARPAPRLRIRPVRPGRAGRPRRGRRVRPGLGHLHAADGRRAGAVGDGGSHFHNPRTGDHRGPGRHDRARGAGRRGRALVPGRARRDAARGGHHRDGGSGHLGAGAGRPDPFGQRVRHLVRTGLAARAHDQRRCHAAFCIFCGFLIVLAVSCLWMLFPPPAAAAPVAGAAPGVGGQDQDGSQPGDAAGEEPAEPRRRNSRRRPAAPPPAPAKATTRRADPGRPRPA